MDATFAFDRCGFKEQVHQHRLAAPDRAVHVETLRRLPAPLGKAEARLPAAQPALAGGLVADQRMVQALQLLCRQSLRRVRFQRVGAAQRTIARQRRAFASGDVACGFVERQDVGRVGGSVGHGGGINTLAGAAMAIRGVPFRHS